MMEHFATEIANKSPVYTTKIVRSGRIVDIVHQNICDIVHQYNM